MWDLPSSDSNLLSCITKWILNHSLDHQGSPWFKKNFLTHWSWNNTQDNKPWRVGKPATASNCRHTLLSSSNWDERVLQRWNHTYDAGRRHSLMSICRGLSMHQEPPKFQELSAHQEPLVKAPRALCVPRATSQNSKWSASGREVSGARPSARWVGRIQGGGHWVPGY